MNTIYDFRSTLTQICPKCAKNRRDAICKYERQLFEEPMGLTVTCRCGYYWYERAADYEEPVQSPFDPCAALDELLELSPLAGVRRNVGLLRAYITGIER